MSNKYKNKELLKRSLPLAFRRLTYIKCYAPIEIIECIRSTWDGAIAEETMPTLNQYAEWVTALEQEATPADLAHIAMSVSGRARLLANEIMTFNWGGDTPRAMEISARAKAIGEKTFVQDMKDYLARREKV